MISVLSASAGSGKTHNLAKTYIEMLLSSPDDRAYRHILAVTFTNKATAEMKGRILEELHKLATTPEKSKYLDDFKDAYGPVPRLKERAGRILVNILHDYSAFSVSTIDKFFQQTLKSFAREIGQFASYQVELDKPSLVQESVDSLLDSLSERDSSLLGWLKESVMYQLAGKGYFNLSGDLVKMANALLGEEHTQLSEQTGMKDEEIYSRKNLSEIRRLCNEYQKDYLSRVEDKAGEILQVLSDSGVSPEDFNRGFMKAVLRYTDIDPRDKLDPPSGAFFRNASDPQKWFPKTRKGCLAKVEGVLDPVLEAFLDLFAEPFTSYRTTQIIVSQLYSLGIYRELKESFSAILKEKNVLSIDDTNSILRRIIAGTETPFIYEKMGVRYDHFLLDEFQDTSTVQWDNFAPLLRESNGRGNENLIVGDVKQSIYRFRGSKWELLSRQVAEDFPESRISSLQENYRSTRSVVSFNNSFFDFAPKVLDTLSGEDLVQEIYNDVEQKIKSTDSQDGSVRVSFCPLERQNELVLASIEEVLSKGGRYRDIAILVKTNARGGDVASYLISRGVPVVSNDSLRVKASDTVRRLVSILSSIDNPADTVGSFLAKDLSIKIPSSWSGIEDLCEKLLGEFLKGNEGKVQGDTLYIQSFLDEVLSWTRTNGNNLSSFLRYWKDADPKISSPEGGDSVRILTIHKSKGLEFPYVIFPSADAIGLYRQEHRWVALDGKDGLPRGIFHVNLTSSCENTAFAPAYKSEYLYQIIDNINAFYVSLTRAEKGLHIISAPPAKNIEDAIQGGLTGIGSLPDGEQKTELLNTLYGIKYKDFGQILYAWAASGVDPRLKPIDPYVFRDSREETTEDGQVSTVVDELEVPQWQWGEIYDFEKERERLEEERERRKEKGGTPRREVQSLTSSFIVYPLNPAPDQGEDPRPARLVPSSDALDYFSSDGSFGIDSSSRLRGILFHSILSRVRVPSDLHSAVMAEVASGSLSRKDALYYEKVLSEKISGRVRQDFFPDDPSQVYNERAIVDSTGEILRPDRVLVRRDGTVVVVDYKFGKREMDKYFRQVRTYRSLYERMGYAKVEAFIWYISTYSEGEGPLRDKVVKVD